MRGPKTWRHRVVTGTTLVLLAACAAVLHARQASRPLPVAANSVAARPGDYVGRYVSLVGVVAERLSPTAFLVDQGDNGAAPRVLVLAPGLGPTLPVGKHVTAVGRIEPFDPEALAVSATNYPLDLPTRTTAELENRPVLLATVVFDGRANALGTWVAPPLSRADAEFDQLMKGAGAANAILRPALEGRDANRVGSSADALVEALRRTEVFWAGQGDDAAAALAREGAGAAAQLTAAAAAGDWDAAAEAGTALLAGCRSCHDAHREQGDDGSYFIRQGPQ